MNRCRADQMCDDGRCIDCEPHVRRGCFDGQPHWIDSCDRRQEQLDTCVEPEVCSYGECVTCVLSNCNRDGFTYSCASGSSEINYSYGGPGPNDVSSYVVSYSNGHVVTCRYTSSFRGNCFDDTGSECTF